MYTAHTSSDFSPATAGSTSSDVRGSGVKAFFSDCVSWPRSKLSDLNQMIDDATDITERTFRANVDATQYRLLLRNMGYAVDRAEPGLRVTRDYAVSFHRSTVFGKRCYFMKWSAIEYVFV